MSNRFEVKMMSDDHAEIEVYGTIGADMFDDGITAKDVAAELKKAANAKTIRVYINSGGGSFFEGQAIASQLIRHPARVEVFIDALAGSAATTIAAAADHVTMAADAWYMIHNPWSGMMGDYRDFRVQAEKMERFAQSMAEMYARLTGLKVTDIRDMMDDETWMTAAEAMEKGFVDAVSEEAKIAACVDPRILAAFKHVPTPVKSDVVEEADIKEDSEKPATAEIIELPSAQNKDLQVKLAKMQTVLSQRVRKESGLKVNHEADQTHDAKASDSND